jgi:predicted RND superfamily exporter protein
MSFFAIAVVIAGLLLYLYSRCLRSTLIVIASSIVAIVWQLGILATLGYELDPYSILVPFLVFAIGVSHGAQKLNGILQDIGRGCDRYVAARYTFRRLFLPGVTALLSDGVGFAVLMIIDIPVIQDLAVTASVGVVVLIFTNLILFPVVLSYFGVTRKAVERAKRPLPTMETSHGLWRFLLSFTGRGRAVTAIVIGALMAIGGFLVSQDLQIGDLDPGAPELRANSRYNQDVRYINDHYSTSSDIFVVIMRTPPDGCIDYEALSLGDELEARLRELPGVEDVRGLNGLVRQNMLGLSEGFIKFNALFRNQDTINYGISRLVPLGFVNTACSHAPMLIYLADHKAATLQRVVDTLETFNTDFQTPKVEFLGAAGNAGFEAATNIVVKKANREMLFYVYGAVMALCLLTFRSIPAVICAVLPLMLTSILCEALMVWLGIGVKVATLPVIALGVGIGIDYALYVLSVLLQGTRAGLPVREAYFNALNATGKVVALIGVTLAAGVFTWNFSPIKFQADMGILLTFMFLWNMVGALVLMPALAHFLLQPRSPQPEASTVPAQ